MTDDRGDGRTSHWGPASSRHESPPPPIASPHAGPNPLISDTGTWATLRRRLGGAALWAWVGGAVVVIGGAVGLALTVEPTDDDTADDTSAVASTATEPPAVATASADDDDTVGTTPAPPPSTTASATAPSAATVPETTAPPSPVSAVGDAFAFVDRAGVSWTVSITGLVEAPPEEGAGGCLVAIGVLTPTETDGAVSSAFSTPTIGLQFGDEILDDSINDCDTTEVEQAGYGWILDASVTTDTPYPFFTEFLLADAAQRPDAIRAGDLFDDTATTLEPVVLDAAPALPPPVGARADVERQPMGEGPDARTISTDFDGAVWDVVVSGLVEVDPRDPDNRRCLLAVGVMTPVEIDGTVSDPFTTPSFGLVVDGRLIDGSAIECDADGAIAAGYDWRLRAEVPAGTPYPFYAEFVVPADADLIDLLIVGLPTDPDAAFYEPAILDDFPSLG